MLTLLSTLLISCGFHLRGNYGANKLMFSSLYLKCTKIAICDNVKNIIINQNLSQISDNLNDAEVMVQIDQEENQRQIQGFNSAGRISNVLLSYSVQLTLFKNGEQLAPAMELISQKSMNINDSLILANNQQEEVIWQELHQELSNQLIRRLEHFKVDKFYESESK